MILKLSDFSPNQVYHLMTQTLIPRPIAWVLTENETGEPYNLAPFSYFTAVSSAPPLVMFSCGAKNAEGALKDTPKNILRTKRFVIHIASEQQLGAVQESAKPLDYGESEINAAHLSLTPFIHDGLPRLEAAPIAYGCELYESQALGDAPQTLIFGKVTEIYIDDNAVNTDDNRVYIHAETVAPLARLGSGYFSGITQLRKS